MDELKRDIAEIKEALLGNQYHAGMVDQVNDNAERLTKLENFEKELSVYLRQLKAIIIILFGAIVTLILKVFTIK